MLLTEKEAFQKICPMGNAHPDYDIRGRNMKILHCADLHARDKNIEEIEKCCDFIVETAVKQEIDLAAVGGDCFDSRDIKLDSRAAKLIIRTVSRLADIAPVVIIKGTESHDGNAPEILQYARGEHDIIVATTRSMQVKVIGKYLYANDDKDIIEPDMILSLFPQPTKQHFNEGDIQQSNEAISQGMTGLFAGYGAQAAQHPNAPHVLIGHWNVSGARLSTGQTLIGQDIDISFDQMMLANPDLICLGHIHMPQQIGDRAFYSGSPYPLTWGETETKGFYIHTLEGKTLVSSEFVPTPCRKLIRFTSDFTAMPFNGVAAQAYEGALVGPYYVRHDITCWQDDAVKINKEELRQLYIAGGAVAVEVRIIRIPRQTVRSEAVLKVESLRDKLVAMAEIKGETVPESILIKADELEAGPAEEVIGRAA